MKLSKCFKHAVKMVVHSKLRSWLTIIGIVIGVAAVISIVSIGEGMQSSMESQMNQLGADIITLTAGMSRGGGMFGGGPPGESSGGSQATEEEIVLDRTDVQALKGIPDIAAIDTQIRGNVEISYLGKSGTVSLTGVDQRYWSSITTTAIAEGRMLDSADQNVIVIGGKLADSYFDQPLGVNKMLTIEGTAYRIVGILDDQSNSIYMPIQMAFNVIPEKDYGIYDSIIIKIKDVDMLDDTITKIEKRLRMVRHVSERDQDFSLSSVKEMQETRQTMMNSMNQFLLAIAAVSLVVGSIGIANTMFTSVLEKTKDIGIMKAIGAKNKDILKIFLLNAGLIGLVGGFLGVILGTIVSGTLNTLLGSSAGMLLRGGTFVSVNSIIVAMITSVGVGVLAGAIPAWQASKLKPVDALRFE